MMRKHVDRRVLLSFGLTSAAGGLAGALLNSFAASRILTVVFGCLLVFAGAMGGTGLSGKLRFEGKLAWIAGAASGFFGGLVGNQGGIRSAAMLGINVPRDAFVATATATGLLVDAARLPVYVAVEGHSLARFSPILVVTTVGVLIGTVVGGRVLRLIPERIFNRVVGLLILSLGLFTLSTVLR
jgi:uncharacterized membrane protein YfcA